MYVVKNTKSTQELLVLIAIVVTVSLFWQISTILTISEIVPSTKTIATFKLPDYNSGKVQDLASLSYNIHILPDAAFNIF